MQPNHLTDAGDFIETDVMQQCIEINLSNYRQHRDFGDFFFVFFFWHGNTSTVSMVKTGLGILIESTLNNLECKDPHPSQKIRPAYTTCEKNRSEKSAPCAKKKGDEMASTICYCFKKIPNFPTYRI